MLASSREYLNQLLSSRKVGMLVLRMGRELAFYFERAFSADNTTPLTPAVCYFMIKPCILAFEKFELALAIAQRAHIWF
jgi:hypothetical protein